jgi:hypothetical protein
MGLETGAIAVVTGYGHACALLDGNEVLCWGHNYSGQLGDGTTTWSGSPVSVNGLPNNVTALSAGYAHTCALTGEGAVWCGGGNSDGQLGDGTETQRLSPVPVPGLQSGVIAIAAGAQHTCAVTTDGGMKCWGYNLFGQLGDGIQYVRVATPAMDFVRLRWPAYDIDGDGKADRAVWRQETGTWYILKSSVPGSYISMQWGTTSDIPVSGDYDGDGKADSAVWRPGNGTWYIKLSGTPGSYTAGQWGKAGDIPISAFTSILNSIPQSY